MMKILYISPYLVMDNIGASVGSWSHLNALRKVVGDENVIVVALDFEQKHEYERKKFDYVIDSFKNKWEKYRNFLTLNGICMNHRVRKEILHILENNHVDKIFIDESTMGKLCRQIKKKFKEIEIITFYHDIKINLCRVWIRDEGIISLPYNCGLIYNEWLNDKYADKKIVLNQRDKELYQHYYKKVPQYLLPHTVNEKPLDLDKYIEYKNKKFTLLFVGADYSPNVTGISWFIHHVMPYLGEKAELQIVGKNMQRYKDIFNSKNVSTIGSVEDLEEWYIKSDVVVSPIFVGGGMKTKTAEAFQYGKKIIATSESYEGYKEFIPESFWGKYCWMAQTAEEFISAVEELMKNKEKSFNREIYEFFQNYYSSAAGERYMRMIINGK